MITKRQLINKSEVEYNTEEMNNFLRNKDIMNAVRFPKKGLAITKQKNRCQSRNLVKPSNSLFVRRNVRAATPALEPIAEGNRVELRNNLRNRLLYNDSSVGEISMQEISHGERQEESKHDSSFGA